MDLDIGHYERFLNTDLKKTANVTAGKIFKSLIEKERDGHFLGKNNSIYSACNKWNKITYI